MPSTDLTILLPLKGRDDFSLRWFTYAAMQGLTHKILVADGGHDEGLEDKLRQSGMFDKVHCDYVRYPFDGSLELYFRKMADALSRVETPYVVIASNDDFIFFEALETSVAFLEANPDYAAARGEIWDFAVAPESPLAPIYGRMTGVKKLYFHPTVTGDSALERVGDLAVKFHSSGHDIVRTSVLADAYARVAKAGLYDLRFADKCVTLMIAAAGKIHRDDHLYMLHQSHGDMSAVTHFKRPSSWVAGPDWDRDFDIFADSLTSAIKAIDGMEFYQTKSGVLKIAARHFLNLVIDDLKSGNPRPPPRIRHAFLQSAKWLVRRNGMLENLARNIYSGGKSRADAKLMPPSFVRKIGKIEQFLKTSPANI